MDYEALILLNVPSSGLQHSIDRRLALSCCCRLETRLLSAYSWLRFRHFNRVVRNFDAAGLKPIFPLCPIPLEAIWSFFWKEAFISAFIFLFDRGPKTGKYSQRQRKKKHFQITRMKTKQINTFGLQCCFYFGKKMFPLLVTLMIIWYYIYSYNLIDGSELPIIRNTSVCSLAARYDFSFRSRTSKVFPKKILPFFSVSKSLH